MKGQNHQGEKVGMRSLLKAEVQAMDYVLGVELFVP